MVLVGNRVSIQQDDMTADAEKLLLPGNFNRFMETRRGSHQGC